MRNFWTAMGMTASMFTVLPLKRVRWEERLRPLALVLLPVIGLGIGLVWWLLAMLAGRLPEHLRGALIAATPWLLTGFIHLDGFMDASDALLSWRSREERQRILKDIHAGAFAVVSLMLLSVFQYAAALDLKCLAPLIFLPTLSRCGSAHCALTLPSLEHSEYAGMEGTQTLVHIPDFTALLSLIALALLSGWGGFAAGIAVLAGYAVTIVISTRSLGGFSGDLAGHALVVSELCGLMALAMI